MESSHQSVDGFTLVEAALALIALTLLGLTSYTVMSRLAARKAPTLVPSSSTSHNLSVASQSAMTSPTNFQVAQVVIMPSKLKTHASVGEQFRLLQAFHSLMTLILVVHGKPKVQVAICGAVHLHSLAMSRHREACSRPRT